MKTYEIPVALSSGNYRVDQPEAVTVNTAKVPQNA